MSGCTLPGNPDIAGIGVRIAIYVQNLLCLIPAIWALLDGIVTKGELQYAEMQTTTNLVLAFAILISSMVQARTLGLSNYHASIVLSMSWMNNTNAFVYFILYVHHKIGLPDGKGRVEATWKAWARHVRQKLSLRTIFSLFTVPGSTKTSIATEGTPRQRASALVKRFVLILGSFHLSLMAALGAWLWSDILSFSLSSRRREEIELANQCAKGQATLVILGQGVPFKAPGLRITSLVLYSAFLAPGANLILPMAMFLGVYIAWDPVSRRLFRVRTLAQEFIERCEAERQDDPWWRDYHSLWCRERTRAQLFLARVGASLTPARLEAVPAYIGLAILFIINLVFIIDVELTLAQNHGLQDLNDDEAEWGFGQILAVLLLLLPLRDLVEALLARGSRRRQREIDEDLREAIEAKDLRAVSRAIERGSRFPEQESETHAEFWSLVLDSNAAPTFNFLRRSRMTVFERQLEDELHAAIEAKDYEKIASVHAQGADLIAGVLHATEASRRLVLFHALVHRYDRVSSFHCQHLDGGVNEPLVQRGETALIMAAESGNEVAVQILLKNPSIDVKRCHSQNNLSVRELALKVGSKRIVRLLDELESNNRGSS